MIEALDRVLQEITETPPTITVTTEESSTPVSGSEEEQEPPLPPAVNALPNSLVIPAALRKLRIVETSGEDCCEDDRLACLDLSDLVRQVVACRPTGVDLKIDAARVGRLISEGADGLRCLNCELISDDEGRSYVVYPATGGKR